ncbi:MAG: fibrobacter succinogenes major paralogous domain-containing protein [Fibrobacter sp.]|nr:fibrobacter succinogenes major paralogous domain-containing protein [Fibrobacter sp.]
MVNASFVYVKEDGSWRRGTELDRDLENICGKANIRATDSMTVKHVLTWFICDVNDDVLGAEIVPTVWREATIAEADTAGFGIPETKKDSVKIGNVNKSYYYVFEGDKWRFGTEMDYAIGPCTASKVGIVDTTSKGKWYKCVGDKSSFVEGVAVPTEWREATNYEMDTYNFSPAAPVGTFTAGNVNKKLYYVKEPNYWRPATSLESSGLVACTEAQEDLIQQFDPENKESWYKCTRENVDRIDTFNVAYTWRKATDLEKDTKDWAAANEGTVRRGSVNDNLTYVFENGKWRSGTRLDDVIGFGCILNIRDTVVQESQFNWYRCFADTADDLSITTAWRKVVENELDISYWNCFKDTLGTILTGPFSGTKMVWDKGQFREPKRTEDSLGRACVSYMDNGWYELPDGYFRYCMSIIGWYQTRKFKDPRDSKLYKVREIGTKLWMAENLNYETGNSYCYGDGASNCTQYGRLYTWAAATEACPNGWHLPDTTEWTKLFNDVGGTLQDEQCSLCKWDSAGKALKSTTGWDNGGNGTDAFGFTALPAGDRLNDGTGYSNVGMGAFFWSSSQPKKHDDKAYYFGFQYNYDYAHRFDVDKGYALSVRCVKN